MADVRAQLRRLHAAVVRHLRAHGEWWWVPILYTVAVLWIYRDLWAVHGRPTALGWDTIDELDPDLAFLARDLAEGRLSLWNPYDKGGYSLVADPRFDRAYPFNWPFATLGAVLGPAWWQVQAKVLGHHIAAACMMHLFLRSRGLSRPAAGLGGLALVSCTALLIHKASNILWPLAWVPLVWLAIDAVCARPSWRRGALLAGALGLCGTAGSPPGLFYVLMLTLPYGVWRLIQSILVARRAGTLRDHGRRLAVALAVTAVVAGALLAISILPTRELVPLALRAQQRGRDFALGGGQPGKAMLAGMLAPTAGKMEAYLGLVALWLGACAVALRPRFDGAIALLLLPLGFIGLLLTFSTGTPLLPWLVEHVPGFDLLRVPGRYKLLTAWCGAALVGFGVEALLAAPRRWSRPRITALVVGAVAVAAAAALVATWKNLPMPPSPRPQWWAVAMAGAAAGVIAALVVTPRRWAAIPAALAGLLIVHDAPTFFHTPKSPPANEQRRTHAGDAAVVARLGDVQEAWRVHDEFVLGERVGSRLRIRDFRGYPAVDALSQRRYVDILEYARKDPAILEAYNVRWVLYASHFRYARSSSYAHPMPDKGGHYVQRDKGLFEAQHAAPLAAWYGTVQVTADGKPGLDAVRAAEGPDGTRRVAVLEKADTAAVPADALARLVAAPPVPSVTATLQSYEPDEIRIHVEAPAEGLVVLNESFFPGWAVTVDGRAATPVRANHLLRAVVVDAGAHDVVWTFRPTRFRTLGALYVAGLLAVLAAAIAAIRSRRASRTGGSTA